MLPVWGVALAAAASILLGAPCLADTAGDEDSNPFAGGYRPSFTSDDEAFNNVPSELLSTDERAPSMSSLLKGPRKREIEACTRKCLPSCTRGGDGMPGLGPLSLRREPVVFKSGFRSRAYCLGECTAVCAAVENAPPAPKDKAAPQKP